MGKKVSFDNSKKTIETIFNIIFWFDLISLIAAIIFKFLFISGKVSIDSISTTSIIITAVGTVLMYFAAKLAHQGKFEAGVIGIIVAISNILANSVLGFIIGIILMIDSILYILQHKK